MIEAARLAQPIYNHSLTSNPEKKDPFLSAPRQSIVTPARSNSENNAHQQQAKLKEMMVANPLPQRLQEALIMQAQTPSTSSEGALLTEKLLNEQQELELLENEKLRLTENTGLAGGRAAPRSEASNRSTVSYMLPENAQGRFNPTQRRHYQAASNLYGQLMQEVSGLMNATSNRNEITTRVIESELSSTIQSWRNAVTAFNQSSPNAHLPDYSINTIRNIYIPNPGQ